MTVWLPRANCGGGGGTPPGPGWPAFGWVFTAGTPTPLAGSDIHISGTGNGYPQTYNNGDGDSCVAGFTGSEPAVYVNQTGGDAQGRFGGTVAQASGITIAWRIDIANGGQFDVSLAFGRNNAGECQLSIDAGGPVLHSWSGGIQGGLSPVSAFGALNNTVLGQAAWYVESNHIWRTPTLADASSLYFVFSSLTQYVHLKSIRLTRV